MKNNEIMLKQCLLTLCIVIILIAVYFPTRHARHYDYIKIENIYNSLKFENSHFINSNLKDCNYQKVILNNEDVEINSVTTYRNFSKPFAGEFYIKPYQIEYNIQKFLVNLFIIFLAFAIHDIS